MSTESKNLIRINKALADAGLCSRRKAEDLIVQGLVQVNGQVVTELSHKVDPDVDRISVKGQLLGGPQKRTTLLLHKPVRVMCTANDPEGRQTVLDILPKEYAALRLYPVGRLDYFSEGLLLLTDDGPLAQLLAHPRHHLAKIYEVSLRGYVSEQALTTMRRGMTLAEGERLAPVGVRVLSSQQDITVIRMTLRQGLNRQIRRMCRDLNLTILKLTRVSQGPLELGTLPSGKVRALSEAEVEALKNAARNRPSDQRQY